MSGKFKSTFLFSLLVFSKLTLAEQFPSYSLMLIGGGLTFCSSVEPRECEKQLVTEEKAHTERYYQVNKDKITLLEKSFWAATRAATKQQVLTLLKKVAQGNSGVITEKQLINFLRNTDIDIKGKSRSGHKLLRSLSQKEYDLVFDSLQVPDLEEALFGRGDRHKTYASLANSKSEYSKRMLRRFVEMAASITEEDKPKILFVTAASRDPFQFVDLYQNLLSQAGATAQWLPIEVGLWQGIASKKHKIDDNRCSKIDSYRTLHNSAFHRSDIYPDLADYQKEFCTYPKQLIELVKEADGIFFTDGDPSLLVEAFITEQGTESNLLNAMKSKYYAGKLIIAADGGAVAAMAGGRRADINVPMVTNGESKEGLLKGAYAVPAPLPGCEKDKSCPAKLSSKSLTYNQNGGLGFFNHGVLDSQLSEKARQARMIRVALDSEINWGYGLDERTALLVGLKPVDDYEISMKVIGENGVLVVDTSESRRYKGFNPIIPSVNSHYLTHQDRLFFRADKLVINFADWKYNVSNLAKPIIKSGNALISDNYRQTTNLLCQNGTQSATLKDSRLGKHHAIVIQKGRNSISLVGDFEVKGKRSLYCSYRDYYLDIKPL